MRQASISAVSAFALLLAGVLPASATDYYVSPSGKDTNSGRSPTTAWQTIAKLNAVSFAAGDRLLFEGGRTFTGTLAFDSGDTGTEAGPITVTSYGTGRATIDAGTSRGISIYNTSGIRILNLNVVGSGYTTNTDAGILAYADLSGDVKLPYVAIESVAVAGFGTSGVEIGAWSGATGFRDVTIKKVNTYQNGRHGINMYAAVQNVHQNVYVGYVSAWSIPGLSVDESTGDGITLGSVDGAIVERSVVHDNGTGAIGPHGPIGIWTYHSNNVTIQYNESYNNHTGGWADGAGFALDVGVTGSVLQYNYSHGNDGAGLLVAGGFDALPNANNTVRYNISQNDGRRNGYAGIYVWGRTSASQFYNNTIYTAADAGYLAHGVYIGNDYADGSYAVNLAFRNNIIAVTGGIPTVEITAAALAGSSVRFEANSYYDGGGPLGIVWGDTTYGSLSSWEAATGQEVLNGRGVGLAGDPQLSNAGGGPTVGDATQLVSLGAYRLQSTSPLIDAGLTLTALGINAGPSDFYGTTLYQGNGADIGANEVVGGAPPPPPPPTSTPFSGTPSAVPGRIEAEQFDNGGQGVAYYDTTTGNSGGQYRNTDVDIEATADAGGGYNVGWMAAGEWLNYTIAVASTGTYTLQARVASNGPGGTFHVEANGTNVSGTLAIPNTGAWQAWTTMTAPMPLSAGTQLLRIVLDTNGPNGNVGNINNLDIVSSTEPPPASTPFTGTPIALPGQIEAEHFDNGGQNLAYNDAMPGNSGGQYRTTDVDIETTTDAGGGYDVGWIVPGEWLTYAVNVTATGTYTLDARVACIGPGGTFHVEFGGVNATGALTIPSTGGWQQWIDVFATVSLPAGPQTMRIVFDSAGSSGYVGNVNYVIIRGAAASTPYTGTPAAIPGTVEAENFDNGGEGIAYYDATPGNSGGQYRNTDVDLEATTDAGGGDNVGWIAPGEWLNYTVTVAASGSFTLAARVACIGPGGTFHVEFGGVNVTGQLTIPGTGGWQQWTTVTVPVTLAAGRQTMRLVFDTVGSSGFVGNLNYVRLTAAP